MIEPTNQPVVAEPCANCGHVYPHNRKTGFDIYDGCSHPDCNCGYFQPVPAPESAALPEVVVGGGEAELLPCPLCGSTNLFLRDIAGWELDCRNCELSLVLANDPSREGVIERWNTRTPAPSPSESKGGGSVGGPCELCDRMAEHPWNAKVDREVLHSFHAQPSPTSATEARERAQKLVREWASEKRRDDEWLLIGDGKLLIDRIAAALQTPEPSEQHVEYVFDGLDCCKVCGLVKPAGGWIKPCSGKTPELSLRAEPNEQVKQRARAAALDEAANLMQAASWLAEVPVKGNKQRLAILFQKAADAIRALKYEPPTTDVEQES